MLMSVPIEFLRIKVAHYPRWVLVARGAAICPIALRIAAIKVP